MKTLQFFGNRDLRFVDIPKPTPGPDEVLLRVTDAGLSQGTVAEFIEGPFIANAEPHPLTGLALPFIPCQEFGGEVEAVGEGVDDTLIGTFAAVLPAIRCNECANCKSGKDNLCEKLAYRGLLGAHGGFTEYLTVKTSDLFPVKDATLLNLVEPMLVATHAIAMTKAKAELSGTVHVLGAGCIGICTAAILQQIHKLDVTLSDPRENRLARAAGMGFKTMSVEDVEQSAGSANIVFDAAGKELQFGKQPLDLAIDICQPGGSIVGIGTYFITLDLLPARFLFSEKTIIPSFAYTSADVATLAKNITALELDFASMITRIPFDQIIEKGYYQAELDRDVFTRIVTSVFD